MKFTDVDTQMSTRRIQEARTRAQFTLNLHVQRALQVGPGVDDALRVLEKLAECRHLGVPRAGQMLID